MRGFRELMITRETHAPPQSYAYNTVQETLIRGHPEMSSSKIGLFQTYIHTPTTSSHHFENLHTYPISSHHLQICAPFS